MSKKTHSSPAPKKPAPKKVIAIRQDLIPRLIEKARQLKQNPNQLVNLITEGGLDAMDAEGHYEIPVIQLYRSSNGKSLMTSKAMMTLFSVVVPDIYEIDHQQQRILLDLINKHDGPLTPGILKGYRQLSLQINKQRIENENQVARLKRSHPSH
jgi:hypothetical protein